MNFFFFDNQKKKLSNLKSTHFNINLLKLTYYVTFCVSTLRECQCWRKRVTVSVRWYQLGSVFLIILSCWYWYFFFISVRQDLQYRVIWKGLQQSISECNQSLPRNGMKVNRKCAKKGFNFWCCCNHCRNCVICSSIKSSIIKCVGGTVSSHC